MILWYNQEEQQLENAERFEKHFRDREIEYETGELVMPGWTSIGDVGARYGGDEASPFD